MNNFIEFSLREKNFASPVNIEISFTPSVLLTTGTGKKFANLYGTPHTVYIELEMFSLPCMDLPNLMV